MFVVCSLTPPARVYYKANWRWVGYRERKSKFKDNLVHQMTTSKMILLKITNQNNVTWQQQHIINNCNKLLCSLSSGHGLYFYIYYTFFAFLHGFIWQLSWRVAEYWLPTTLLGHSRHAGLNCHLKEWTGIESANSWLEALYSQISVSHQCLSSAFASALARVAALTEKARMRLAERQSFQGVLSREFCKRPEKLRRLK